MSADRALLVRPDGSTCEIWPKGKEFTAEELHMLVDGYIEIVRIELEGEMIYMVVNEDGLGLELPVNWKASLFASRHIVGNAVLVPTNLIS